MARRTREDIIIITATAEASPMKMCCILIIFPSVPLSGFVFAAGVAASEDAAGSPESAETAPAEDMLL